MLFTLLDKSAVMEPQPSMPPEPEATPTVGMTASEDLELICEYPPRGSDPPAPPETESVEHRWRAAPQKGSGVTSEPSVMSSAEPPSTGEQAFSGDSVMAKQQKELHSHGN